MLHRHMWRWAASQKGGKSTAALPAMQARGCHGPPPRERDAGSDTPLTTATHIGAPCHGRSARALVIQGSRSNMPSSSKATRTTRPVDAARTAVPTSHVRQSVARIVESTPRSSATHSSARFAFAAGICGLRAPVPHPPGQEGGRRRTGLRPPPAPKAVEL